MWCHAFSPPCSGRARGAHGANALAVSHGRSGLADHLVVDSAWIRAATMAAGCVAFQPGSWNRRTSPSAAPDLAYATFCAATAGSRIISTTCDCACSGRTRAEGAGCKCLGRGSWTGCDPVLRPAQDGLHLLHGLHARPAQAAGHVLVHGQRRLHVLSQGLLQVLLPQLRSRRPRESLQPGRPWVGRLHTLHEPAHTRGHSVRLRRWW